MVKGARDSKKFRDDNEALSQTPHQQLQALRFFESDQLKKLIREAASIGGLIFSPYIRAGTIGVVN
jgi:hypothetical protein